MRSDPRHWRAWYEGDDEEAVRLRRRFSLSDRCRYYWTRPEVQAALGRLHANLEGRRLPRGLVSQYLPDAAGAVAGDEPGLPGRLERWHVRRVLDRYARACRPAPAGLSAAAELPLR
jgi:D-tagatose-1,6-bisphosphate aldolase subunit GatZ/KbaZ